MSYIPLLTGEVLPRSWPIKRGCAALYEFEQLSKRIKCKMHEAVLIAEAVSRRPHADLLFVGGLMISLAAPSG